MVRRHRAHAGPQLEGVERLGHVIHGAEVQALHLVFDVRGAREEKDGDHAQFRLGLHGPANIEPGHIGHVNVEQDQVGLFPAGGGKSGRAAEFGTNLHVLPGKPGLGNRHGFRIVVDDEDFHGAVAPLATAGPVPFRMAWHKVVS